MLIKTTIPNYDGSTIDLSTGFQLAVFQGRELSSVQLEMRHGTQEGAELKDVWYAGVFSFDGYSDGWKLETKSAAFDSKDGALDALKDDKGVAVNFSPFVWLSHRKGADNLHVLKAFGA